MEEGFPKFKRKLVVEQSFQLRYAFIFALTCFFLGLVAIVAMLAFSQSYYGQLEKAGAFLTPTLADIYRHGWIRLCILLVVMTFIYSAIAFYIGLVLTRNIVGPVMAFKSRIEKLLKTKKAEKFDLRTRDELRVLTEIYDRVAEQFGKAKGSNRDDH